MTHKILVIDDEASIRNAFILALEDKPIAVDAVESGEKGLSAAQRQKYDLIFLDLNMPGLNGVETLRRIRAHDKKVPIYIITAFHQTFFAELLKCVEEGLQFELLNKPIDQKQIAGVVQGVLHNAVVMS